MLNSRLITKNPKNKMDMETFDQHIHNCLSLMICAFYLGFTSFFCQWRTLKSTEFFIKIIYVESSVIMQNSIHKEITNGTIII
jgi:hypothetical protein